MMFDYLLVVFFKQLRNHYQHLVYMKIPVKKIKPMFNHEHFLVSFIVTNYHFDILFFNLFHFLFSLTNSQDLTFFVFCLTVDHCLNKGNSHAVKHLNIHSFGIFVEILQMIPNETTIATVAKASVHTSISHNSFIRKQKDFLFFCQAHYQVIFILFVCH